tara:strand:+ start:17402 stop:17590 length:189 start_codon:yes stop_codon:yes gene_type:complete
LSNSILQNYSIEDVKKTADLGNLACEYKKLSSSSVEKTLDNIKLDANLAGINPNPTARGPTQ